MSALVRSGVSDLHKVNLLKDSAARAQEPLPPPPPVIPTIRPLSTAEDHSQPSGKRTNDSKQVLKGKQQNLFGSCYWLLSPFASSSVRPWGSPPHPSLGLNCTFRSIRRPQAVGPRGPSFAIYHWVSSPRTEPYAFTHVHRSPMALHNPEPGFMKCAS